MREGDTWTHASCTIVILDRYEDEAYCNVLMTLSGWPGIVEVENGSNLVIGWEHEFALTIPRDYPHDLDLNIRSQTPLYHPRVAQDSGKACYQVFGELDRVFLDLILNLLMRPDVIRPPSLYPEADWGFDKRKMEWYIESGPEAVHAHLLSLWGAGPSGPAEAPVEIKAGPIRFLE